MQQPVKPSGTDPAADGDAIVNSELKKLEDYRSQVSEENQKYVENHPEMKSLIDQFVSAVILHKPDDIVKFGTFFFNNLGKSGTIGPSPVVIAGPSGVGKGTLINHMINKFPKVFGFSVSHTTREPRPGETHGVDYNFVSKEDFEHAVERDEFVEYARVHTNYYGTSYQAIDKIRNQGRICILDIDIQGVQKVKKSKLDCKYIFVAPPSISELEKRLKGRNTETQEKIKIRMETAIHEIEFGQQPGNFDAIIVNEDLDKSFTDFARLFQNWFPDLDLYLEN